MCSTEESNEDENFVDMFRKEHNEQFYVLVKMHLSFLLHMTTEESECFYEKVKLKKWNIVPFGKKSKHKNVLEGASLTQEGICQVSQLINYLKNEDNLKSDGIFRRSGSLERQQDLKNLLNAGTTVSFNDSPFSVHDCASVLKSFLADLPEPLTTDTHFPVYCQIAELYKVNDISNENKILQSVQLLFLLLPKENRSLLKDIFRLLYDVMLHEKENRMSSDNLAKLFTPHLLCPRKLAPEMLLKDSQTLFGIVSFMIKKFLDLFKIPSQLMLDFRTHYEQKNVLNESVKGAAHTVFTFVDNKLTAKENEENVTETALAQLYAHIQSLPESSKKRKLVKQFNKENGQGTPLQVIRSGIPKNKSFGDSIKKHMFHKKLIKNVKKSGFTQLKSASSEEILNSPSTQKITRGRLFCHHFDSSTEEEPHSNDENPSKRLKNCNGTPINCIARPRSRSDSDLSLGEMSGVPVQYLTSTPACVPLRTCGEEVFTPEGQDRKSMSPITMSAQRMPRAMQETMMTPRSRKPVLLLSGTNINNLAQVSPKQCFKMSHLEEEHTSYGTKEEETVEHHGSKNFEHSYQADEKKKEEPMTVDREKSVQESGLGFLGGKKQQGSMKRGFTKSKSDGDLILSQETNEKAPKMNLTDTPHSLSDTFRQYLTSRDMLTVDSPNDSTFSSRTDDFRSPNNSKDFSNRSDNYFNSFDSSFTNNLGNFNDERMTDSMLYILDGNAPREGEESGEKKLVLKPRQFDEDGKPIVFETSF